MCPTNGDAFLEALAEVSHHFLQQFHSIDAISLPIESR